MEQENLLCFKIKDSGCGIKKEVRQKLFSLFNNVKFKDDINQHGIGLGLSICKKITDAFKGKLLCKSEINQGKNLYLVQCKL